MSTRSLEDEFNKYGKCNLNHKVVFAPKDREAMHLLILMMKMVQKKLCLDSKVKIWEDLNFALSGVRNLEDTIHLLHVDRQKINQN